MGSLINNDRHGKITRTIWAYTVEVLDYQGQVKRYSVAMRKRKDDKVLSDALRLQGAREARIVSLSINVVGMTPEQFVKRARILSSKEVKL